MNVFSQEQYAIRFEWGSRGAREAAARGDIVIIVDVLRFSSAVIAALQAGFEICPLLPGADVEETARYFQAIPALKQSSPEKNGHSLSPLSFLHSSPCRVVLPSLNGSMCSTIAADASAVLLGALLNAEAVALYAWNLYCTTNHTISVIACGEQWQNAIAHDNALRPAVEDYLGAGAILSFLPPDQEYSPEAIVCRTAFESCADSIGTLIRESGSGKELSAKGYGEDVLFSSVVNFCTIVPRLTHGIFKTVSL